MQALRFSFVEPYVIETARSNVGRLKFNAAFVNMQDTIANKYAHMGRASMPVHQYDTRAFRPGQPLKQSAKFGRNVSFFRRKQKRA